VTEAIKVTSHVARDFLQNATYFNTVPKVVWEYVSNSVDNPRLNQIVNVEVEISKDIIVITDDGSGMTRDELSNFFQMHGPNIKRIKGEKVRGMYGTGKCAGFGIADRLRIETVKNHILNSVELSREDIEKSMTGGPFSVRDIMVDKTTTEEDGTRIIVSKLNIKSLDLQQTIAYVERHLGRKLHKHRVIINDHVCEYSVPNYMWQKIFQPSGDLPSIIGNVKLTINVSPIPLEKERGGIDVLSDGIWHDTTFGNDLDVEFARHVFGEVDVPILEERYTLEKIPPFDNTRNMSLNVSNSTVASLLGWINLCLQEVQKEYMTREKSKKKSEETIKLERHARDLENILNNDFRGLQMELEKIKRMSKIRDGNLTDIIPGEGTDMSRYKMGGPDHSKGRKGSKAGPGEIERPGPSLLPGDLPGSTGNLSEKKQRRSTFHVIYDHLGRESKRSNYDRENRTITINLDHPQISFSYREGLESKRFLDITYEIAFVEYAIALGYEQTYRDQFYTGSQALFDISDTINRVSRVISLFEKM
jgi:hypothetical protein